MLFWKENNLPATEVNIRVFHIFPEIEDSICLTKISLATCFSKQFKIPNFGSLSFKAALLKLTTLLKVAALN